MEKMKMYGAAAEGETEGKSGTVIETLGTGKQQLIEIAKALNKKRRYSDPG